MHRTRSLVIGTALVITASLAACSNGQGAAGVAPSSSAAPPVPSAPTSSAPTGDTSAAPTGKATAAPAKKETKAKAPTTSDLSDLKRAGIKSGKSVLIDVADDGADLFLQVGKGSRVDFTGTTRTDSTMMALHPAPVAAKNQVIIKPPFFNEDLSASYCVADTRNRALKLENCTTGKASQIWRVALAGDSGQFELHGTYGVFRVGGRTGLQVLPFAS